jgi:TnpA family transposase
MIGAASERERSIMRRALLSAVDCQALWDFPDDEESLLRFASFDLADLALIEERRRPHNRLGFALQLCVMRQRGRPFDDAETLPTALIAHVARQLHIDSTHAQAYAEREQTRFEHGRRIARYLDLHAVTRADRRAALLAAIEAAAAGDKGLPIAKATTAAFRQAKAILPALSVIERIGIAARAIARRRAEAALLSDLTPDLLAALDALLVVDPLIGQTRFSWLRTASQAPGVANLDALLARLAYVHGFGIAPARRALIHPDRLRQMIREGEITPSFLASDFSEGRRRATLAAQLLNLSETLTDQALLMFCKIVGKLFAAALSRKKQRHAELRIETGKALRLFRDTLRTLVAANEADEDAIEALDREIGWHRLIGMQPTIEAMVAQADPEPLTVAVAGYGKLHRIIERFLSSFVFHSARRNDPLLAALDLIRTLHVEGRRILPDAAPVGHLPARDLKTIRASGKLDRRLYELATLAVLKERLRATDIWADGGRTLRPLRQTLMPVPEFTLLKQEDRLDLGVESDGAAFLARMRQTMDFNLTRLAHRARSGKLEGVRLQDGKLVVSPVVSDPPDEAVALNRRLNALYPLIEAPDLLREVHDWTGFAHQFTHLRTGEAARSIPAILASTLADATNLGPSRMAIASKGLSAHQIAWTRLFHTRAETYRAAQAVIVDAHAAQPHAKLWGSGSTVSSDGQFFRASDRAAARADINLHYGSEPGAKFYSHLSDQYGYFSILPISPTESEAPYVLDGLFDHDGSLAIDEHYTDTGGASDHVFALFMLIGKRFAPRLRNLKDRSLHAFEKADAYPALKEHIGAPINAALILECWDELLHLGASIATRTVAPSAALKRLAATANPSRLAKALRELGRIERTLFMIEWYSDSTLRKRCQAGLNKGEAAHKLKRAVFFHERGEIRDRSFDSQAFRASGLNLAVSAIVLWNTVYLSRAVAHLRAQGPTIADEILRHVSPLAWEHINLTGIYSWDAPPLPSGSLRPLRTPRQDLSQAA